MRHQLYLCLPLHLSIDCHPSCLSTVSIHPAPLMSRNVMEHCSTVQALLVLHLLKIATCTCCLLLHDDCRITVLTWVWRHVTNFAAGKSCLQQHIWARTLACTSSQTWHTWSHYRGLPLQLHTSSLHAAPAAQNGNLHHSHARLGWFHAASAAACPWRFPQHLNTLSSMTMHWWVASRPVARHVCLYSLAMVLQVQANGMHELCRCTANRLCPGAWLRD